LPYTALVALQLSSALPFAMLPYIHQRPINAGADADAVLLLGTAGHRHVLVAAADVGLQARPPQQQLWWLAALAWAPLDPPCGEPYGRKLSWPQGAA
jgi:hypothetical protein